MIPKQSGYIALVSVLIISGLLVMALCTVSMSGFFSRFNTLNSEFKEVSTSPAESCINIALLKLAQNISYGGNEIILIGDRSCTIRSVVPGSISGQLIVESQAIVEHAYTNLRVTINSSDFSVISWQEIPMF